MIDPRIEGMRKRFSSIDRIFAIVSGKGGVGKTLFSTIFSLILAENGEKVGLFDVDFQGPTCHVVLGVKNVYPEEEKGIIPPKVDGIRFLSLYFFLGDNPAPLRGEERTNVIIELLSITNWIDTRILVLDMPPGSGDDVLDVLNLFDRKEFIVITTPSRLAIETASRTIKLLKEINASIVGLVGNMVKGEDTSLRKLAEKFNINYLGSIPFDESIEKALGSIHLLRKTEFAEAVRKIVDRILNS